MDRFTHDGFQFDVTDAGPRDGEVVVLLHGFPADRTCWHAVTPLLTDAGYRVLAPDQRGYSPGARPQRRRDYRIELLIDDVVAMLDAAGAEQAHVVGHDWGGAVAWAIAQRRPQRVATVTSLGTPTTNALVRSMVRSSQLAHSWYMFLYQLPVLPELGFTAGNGDLIRRTLQRSGLQPDVAERYAERMREPGAARAAINWYRAIPLSRPSSAPIEVPALYVYPTGDLFLGRTAADLTAKDVSGDYRFEVVEDASHWLPEEHPDTVARLLLEFIVGRRRSSAGRR